MVVVRSRRRRRTAEVRARGDHLEVRVPAGLSADDERALVERLVARLHRRRSAAASDAALERRALALSERYLEGRARPRSVRYAEGMRSRWGSATPATGDIRLSARLRAVPPWVLDYVLVHELCHLIAAGHGPAFHRLLARYPRAERARGYLQAVAQPPTTAT